MQNQLTKARKTGKVIVGGLRMERKIYASLLEWKNSHMKMPLMVIGARQVGKTYIIKEFCKKEFKDYVYINLFDEEQIVEIFKQKISITEKLKLLKVVIKNSSGKSIDFENTLIFFDEVQESEEIISALKYFNEADIEYKIICAGSLLGVKLNRMTKAFPVGKVDIINMYPMDFEEFLMASMGKEIIDTIQECYDNDEPMIDIMHNELIALYRLYLCTGGMPASVENILLNDKDILKYNRNILKNIIKGYLNDMKKYVKDATETVRISNIYNSIPAQIGNKSNKFQYSKVRSGARSKNYETALHWLLASKLVTKICSLKSVQIPPEVYKDDEVFKLYLSDVGILMSILNINFEEIILDKDILYKGDIAENYVLQQLTMRFENVYYWKNSNTAEVDFIINTKDGLIPIEVKAGDNVSSKSLKIYMNQYKPNYAIRLSTKNFGVANGIKSVPLYATFCIK